MDKWAPSYQILARCYKTHAIIFEIGRAKASWRRTNILLDWGKKFVSLNIKLLFSEMSQSLRFTNPRKPKLNINYRLLPNQVEYSCKYKNGELNKKYVHIVLESLGLAQNYGQLQNQYKQHFWPFQLDQFSPSVAIRIDAEHEDKYQRPNRISYLNEKDSFHQFWNGRHGQRSTKLISEPWFQKNRGKDRQIYYEPNKKPCKFKYRQSKVSHVHFLVYIPISHYNQLNSQKLIKKIQFRIQKFKDLPEFFNI